MIYKIAWSKRGSVTCSIFNESLRFARKGDAYMAIRDLERKHEDKDFWIVEVEDEDERA